MGIIFSTAVRVYLKGNILSLAFDLDSVYTTWRIVNSASDSGLFDYTEATAKGTTRDVVGVRGAGPRPRRCGRGAGTRQQEMRGSAPQEAWAGGKHLGRRRLGPGHGARGGGLGSGVLAPHHHPCFPAPLLPALEPTSPCRARWLDPPPGPPGMPRSFHSH